MAARAQYGKQRRAFLRHGAARRHRKPARNPHKTRIIPSKQPRIAIRARKQAVQGGKKTPAR